MGNRSLHCECSETVKQRKVEVHIPHSSKIFYFNYNYLCVETRENSLKTRVKLILHYVYEKWFLCGYDRRSTRSARPGVQQPMRVPELIASSDLVDHAKGGTNEAVSAGRRLMAWL